MSSLLSSSSVADVAGLSALTSSTIGSILQKFGELISKCNFDSAREYIERAKGIRTPVSTSINDSLCFTLLHVCLELAKYENEYYSLDFMLPKAFFRKESNLLSLYSQLKGELCGLEEVSEFDPVGEDLRRRLIDFLSARISLINVYNSCSTENLGLPSEITVLSAVLSSVEDLITPFKSHINFSALFATLTAEVNTLKLLLHSQLALIRCEFLGSLLKLREAYYKLLRWLNSIDFAKPRSKGVIKFFHFGSHSHSSPPQLCEWMEEFFKLLIAKYSLYFHDFLQPQCSPIDFEHAINHVKTPNFVHSFNNFFRKMSPSFVLLVANRGGVTDIPAVVGYNSIETVDGSEGELRKNFPVLLKMGGDFHTATMLLPSISILMQQSVEKSISTDRITYCYDHVFAKSFFVHVVEYKLFLVVVFSRYVSERDSTTVNFMSSICHQLRCGKICQSLRRS